MNDAPDPVVLPSSDSEEVEPTAALQPGPVEPRRAAGLPSTALLGGALLIVAASMLAIARNGFRGGDSRDTAEIAAGNAPIEALTLEPLDARVTAPAWGTRKHQMAFARAFAEAIKPYQAGDYQKAIERMQDLASLFPHAPEPLVYGGVSELFVGHPDKAIDLLTRAAPLSPDAFSEEIMWYLALAERAAGQSGLKELRTVCAVGADHGPRACAALRELEARERLAAQSPAP